MDGCAGITFLCQGLIFISTEKLKRIRCIPKKVNNVKCKDTGGSIFVTQITYPPSQAILRFLLKEGFKSHAVNPPLIDASDQIFNSVSAWHAARFSLLDKI